jgi:competence protein ComFA
LKAHLYAARIGECWQWQWSIHLQTDMIEWFRRYGAQTSIVVLDPPISLGQAISLANVLNEEYPQLQRALLSRNPAQDAHLEPLLQISHPIQHTKNLPTQNHTPQHDYATTFNVQKLLHKLISLAARSHMNPALCQSFNLNLYMQNDGNHGDFKVDHPIDRVIYDRLVQSLSGRSLLVEEIYQLMEHIQLSAESNDWMCYVQLAHLRGDLEITNGLRVEEHRDLRTFWRKSKSFSCKRCGSGSERMFVTPCVFCGGDCPYCEECLTMGRTRYCSLLIQGRKIAGQREVIRGVRESTYTEETSVRSNETHTPRDYREFVSPWGLSKAQTAASLEGLRFLEEGNSKAELFSRGSQSNRQLTVPRKFLIWAVTGAGKTEMIFPFIQYELARGGRVLVATPRKDVVLELRPRLAKAFANNSVVTLYGGSEERWEQGDITLATTHQLMRFREAYDLVIIDEIDAFPYHNNPVLEYAAQKVCKPNGNYILLSATPPPLVRKSADRGKLPHVRVPVRFHQHPLPVPEWMEAPALKQMLKASSVPAALLKRMQISVERGAQLFIFVPNIQLVEPMVELLQKKLSFQLEAAELDLKVQLPNGEAASSYTEKTAAQRNDANRAIGLVAGTSSKDTSRAEKVQSFRDRRIRVLVTTTILERGVTIPKSDVYIIDSDSRLFDEAALVQMAGRAGRSKEDPAGKVYFAAKERTQSQSEAIRQINRMNRLARKQGYFKGGRS